MTMQMMRRQATQERVGLARNVIKALIHQKAMILSNPELENAGVFYQKQGERELTELLTLDRIFVEQLYLLNLLQCQTIGSIRRYDANLKTRAIYQDIMRGDMEGLARLLSEHDPMFIMASDGVEKITPNMQETPIQILARKRDKNGKKYLSPRMIAAAERLREDFEIGEIDPRVTQYWQEFIDEYASEPVDMSLANPSTEAARRRWANAMRELGLGLCDIAYRVCCNLEGLETAESMLGWSARSGKIVLRIALIRLADFYKIPDIKSG